MRDLSGLSASVKALSFKKTSGSGFEVLFDFLLVLDEEDAEELGLHIPARGDGDREVLPRPKALEFQGPKRAARLTLSRESDRAVLLEAGVGIPKLQSKRFGRDGDRVGITIRAVSSVDTRAEVLSVVETLLEAPGRVVLDLSWSGASADQGDLFDTAGKRNPLFLSRGSEVDENLAILLGRTVFPELALYDEKTGPRVGTLLSSGFDVRVAGESDTKLDGGDLLDDLTLEIHRPGRPIVQATTAQTREALESYARRRRSAALGSVAEETTAPEESSSSDAGAEEEPSGPPPGSMSSGDPGLDADAAEFLADLDAEDLGENVDPADAGVGEPEGPGSDNVFDLAARKAAGETS